jgi:hypothetical protein
MGLWCKCGDHWPRRTLPKRETRHCFRLKKAGTCTLAEPCVACLAARSRAVARVGWEFTAWGVRAQQAIVENA